MMEKYSEQGEWDFRGENTKQYTHCFHIYPAMMIPQIARELITRFGKKGGVLFDPYCGTGTSLVEARIAGMDAFGTDINPTARMIAKSKTMDYNLIELKKSVDSFLEDMEKNLELSTDYKKFKEPEFVTWERLEDWFPKRSIAEISYALSSIENNNNTESQIFLKIALSECLRLVSYQRNGEFKLYRMKEEKRQDFYESLLPKIKQRIQRNLEGLEDFMEVISEERRVEIFDFNTVETNGFSQINIPVDIVVTSPPYGDSGTTVAYAQFSWLSNVWLGLDDQSPGALDRKLMGGGKQTIDKFGFQPMDDAIQEISNVDEKRAKDVMHFYDEYLQSMKNVASRINKGGYSCYVVGNRTVKGIQLPTDQFTAWAFNNAGFEHQSTYIREIPNKRMPSKNSPSNKKGIKSSTMSNEYIVICKKM
ncbi:MAG: TRM11 family SAM-dependent methyltransferase [Candidatus Thalassarchaeaceae archaeon]